MGLNVLEIIKSLPKFKGTRASFTLGAEQIGLIAKQDYTKAGNIAKQLLKVTKEPTLEVAYKAKSNYAIAGLKLKDGENLVGTGAVSITNPASNQAVVKYRVNTAKSSASGFVDGGKVADTKNMEVGIARKGGNVKADVKVGDATAHHLDINEEEVLQCARDFDCGELLKGYARVQNELQAKADGIMTEVRRFLRGEKKKAAPSFLTKGFSTPENKKVAVNFEFPKVKTNKFDPSEYSKKIKS
jgi:hypothetical protein